MGNNNNSHLEEQNNLLREQINCMNRQNEFNMNIINIMARQMNG